MSNQKTYSFLIKFLISVIIFLGISLLVHSFMDTAPEIQDSSIPYLSVSDETVDSMINLMTLDEKLDIVIQLYQKSVMDTLKYDSQTDSLQSLFSADKKKTGIISQKFEALPYQKYLFALTDTAFLNNYLRNIYAKDYDNSHSDYVFINELVLESLYDSVFAQNYMERIALIQNTYREHGAFLSYRIKSSDFEKLIQTQEDSTLFGNELVNSLHNETDLLLLDSVSVEKLPEQVHGIMAAQIEANSYQNEENVLKLLNAPINIYLFQESEYQNFKSAAKGLIQNNDYSEIYLNQKLKNIIKAHIWQQSVNYQNNNEAFYSQLITQQIAEKSICLLNNPDSLIPLKTIHNRNFYVVSIGTEPNKIFIENADKYVAIRHLQLKTNDADWGRKLKYLQNNNFIIFTIDTIITDTTFSRQFDEIINAVSPSNCVFVNFENYLNLRQIPDSFACIQVSAKSENDYKYSAQAVFGGIALEGQLSYAIGDNYPFGKKHTSPRTRLKYTIPEDAGLDHEKLAMIEKIAYEGISRGAFPGCQVFVAKNGKVVFDKSFGYHTYQHEIRVSDGDVYDLASVTKIAATTIAAMKMISDGKMSLNDKLGKFFKNTTIDYTRIKPDTVVNIDTFFHSSIENWKDFLAQNDTLNINDSSFVTIYTIITKLTPSRNIFKVPLTDLLMHKSGIVPAMPVFRYMYYKAYYIKQLKEKLATIQGKNGPMFDYRSFELPVSFPDNTKLPDSLKQRIKNGFKKQYEEYFSKTFNKDTASIRLTQNLYLKNRYFDTIWRDTKQLPVFSRKVFQYSDVNMILLQLAIDTLNKRPIDDYLKKNIYNPLGLKNITYLPLKFYNKNKIIPTEWDESWRYGNLQGYVNDPSAALMGGMAGNAGLYSDAHDLGILFQMVLNKGSYGGMQYINPKVVDQFTKRHDDTQRALGFDMPNRKAIVGKKASKKTFGHSGYTGTCVWVDPENEIVYVFLSNRNQPKANNWRIVTYKIRERIHDAIYDAIIKKDEVLPEGNLVAENGE